jgi:hypothetical protein
MKQTRDMDLIRLLLIQLESGESQSGMEKYSKKEIIYHYQLLSDAGLIVARFIEGNDPIPDEVMDIRLTWDGQDFLAAARDNRLWKMAKEKFIQPGVSWTFSILKEWLKLQIHQQVFGVPASS